MEGQKDRRKGRQTLIHKNLPAKAEGPIRSKIYNPSECCLSLHFLWILCFALWLLQHGDKNLQKILGPKYFLSVTGT